MTVQEDLTGTDAERRLKMLVDSYRLRCLWFLRPDFYPRSRAERVRVLDLIQRHGDREAFREAADLRRWLSPDSSAMSAAS